MKLFFFCIPKQKSIKINSLEFANLNKAQAPLLIIPIGP